MRRSCSPTIVVAALALAAASLSPLAVQAAEPTATAPAADSPAPARQQFRERMRERMIERRQERQSEIDRKLSSEQVRDIVEGRLAMSGNANLKVGKVTAKEIGVVSVEIVTKTGALVETREISTRSGMPADIERRTRGDFRGRGGPGGQRFGRGIQADKDLKLSVDQVRKLAEARLILQGNPNLKVGPVKEKDPDTITVDIVASDNSLVTQREIDRHTGRPKRQGA